MIEKLSIDIGNTIIDKQKKPFPDAFRVIRRLIDETYHENVFIISKVTPAQAFRQGILVDVLNPKVAIFFMAFLPQFVRADHGNPALQLFGLGVLVILVAIPVETFFVIAASRTTGFFRQNPKTSIWLERMLGTILISLGLRLAFSEHRQ